MVYAPLDGVGLDGIIDPPPKDYRSYVLSLDVKGVKITDVAKTTVGGRAATIMTITNKGPGQHGSLGCPYRGAEMEHGCFGIQPEYKVRLAVMNAGPPLAIWARTDSRNPDEAFLGTYEQMLATVRFR